MKTISSYIRIPFLSVAINNAVLVVLGSFVVAVFAQISIPLSFSPVPITGQTFAVTLVGTVLGARKGALALMLYLAQGALGFPVFAGFRGGFPILLGPSGGYLFGFVIAAYIIGFLAERGWDRSITKASIAMLLGNAVVYVPGLLQLGFVIGWDKPILTLGFYPFIIGGLIKAAFAAALFPLVWSVFKET